MHHVRVALDVHQVANFHRAVLADAAEIVAAQVDQHDVFGAFFFVGQHFLFERGVVGFVFAARMGAGDRTVFELASGWRAPAFRETSRGRACRDFFDFPRPSRSET